MDHATQFPTTQWSMVLDISPADQTPKGRDAIEHFCRTYWGPLKSFIESLGVPAPDAEDLTQEVFANIHRLDHYANLNPGKGSMRGFLKTTGRNRVHEFHRKMARQKRGGKQAHLPLIEQVPLPDPKEPEKQFDRKWALHLLDLTAAEMEHQYRDRGRHSWFCHLFPIMTKEVTDITYAQAAEKLETTEGAVKLACHRMKDKYRKVLRAEVAKTILSENEVDEEISCLFNALSAP